jgi:hypothetical protein
MLLVPIGDKDTAQQFIVFGLMGQLALGPFPQVITPTASS